VTITVDELRVDFRQGSAALDAARSLFQTWGCFVATEWLDEELQHIRAEIQRLIALAIEQSGCRPARRSTERFDDGFTDLEAQSPAAAAAIFGAARRLTSVHQLSVHPKLLALSQRLMNTDLVMSSPYKPVRIDSQARESRLLPWHQDYPYAQDSLDALVYWIPLQSVDNHNGCVVVAPGSHRSGVYPLKIRRHSADGSGHRDLQLADPKMVESFPHLAVPISDGDVLVFSSLLLHRSQVNASPNIRWTVQVRHGNFAHPVSVAKGWPRGHYESHWFDETHPECVSE
jgi:ectoine hydroxylase-related dioxygenase (phytanoyl-CoA dioxygenase family)